MTQLEDFAVWSNVFYVLFPVWLAYVGRLDAYVMQATQVTLAGLVSIYYHLCWSDSDHVCAGAWSSASERDVWYARDVWMSYTSMVSIASVLASELLFRHQAQGARYHTVYFGAASAATAFLVLYLGDSVATAVVLPAAFVAITALAVVSEARRTKHDWLWFARLAVGAAAIAVGAIFKVVSNRVYYSSGAPEQSDNYLRGHALWHTLSGLGLGFLATLLSAAGPVGYDEVGKQPRK